MIIIVTFHFFTLPVKNTFLNKAYVGWTVEIIDFNPYEGSETSQPVPFIPPARGERWMILWTPGVTADGSEPELFQSFSGAE